MESDSCSVSVLLVVDECECIVPLEIAVVVSQFICKSLPPKNDFDNSHVSYLGKVYFFCLTVISYYCQTNSHDSYYYSPCVFHSGISDEY